MTFKSNWEKTDQKISMPSDTITAMIKSAFPSDPPGSYEIISGGCANLNVKIHLISGKLPFLLRIYLRNKEAAYREQKLGQLLKQAIPIPEIYFIGDYGNYRFAITEYLSGITLRDLLLGDELFDLNAIMFDAGKLLAAIQYYTFPSAGFFDNQLNIAEAISQNGYIEFAQHCLNHPTVTHYLNHELLTKIDHYLEKYKLLFPTENDSHLVHADYDPANLLVDKIKGQWKITGILDWEFSFSGSPLHDVANMLRYAHHMPPQFETSFLHGLKEGFVLPTAWRVRVHLLNLLSLLDCLIRSSLDKHPRRCADILALINHILDELNQQD